MHDSSNKNQITLCHIFDHMNVPGVLHSVYITEIDIHRHMIYVCITNDASQLNCPFEVSGIGFVHIYTRVADGEIELVVIEHFVRFDRTGTNYSFLLFPNATPFVCPMLE